MSIILVHFPRGSNLVEIYATRRCHMGRGSDYVAIYPSLALKKMLLLKGMKCYGPTLTLLLLVT